MVEYLALNEEVVGSMPTARTKIRCFKSPAIHRTPLYRAKAAYWGMLARCGNANGKNPAYANVELRMTRDEFLTWAVPQYERFVERHPGESPSIARKGDAGHYETGNIELLSAIENRSRQKAILQARPDGTKMCGRCRGIMQVKINFGKNRWRPDGLNSWCKRCVADHGRKRRTKAWGMAVARG